MLFLIFPIRLAGTQETLVNRPSLLAQLVAGQRIQTLILSTTPKGASEKTKSCPSRIPKEEIFLSVAAGLMCQPLGEF